MYLVVIAAVTLCGCATSKVSLSETDRSQLHRVCLITEYDVRNDAVPNFDMRVVGTLIRNTDPRPILREAILSSVRADDPVKIAFVPEAEALWFDKNISPKETNDRLRTLLQPQGFDGIFLVRGTSGFSQAGGGRVVMRLDMSGRIFRLQDNKQIYQRFEYQLFGGDYAVPLQSSSDGLMVKNTLDGTTWRNSLETFTRKHWTTWLSKDVMNR